MKKISEACRQRTDDYIRHFDRVEALDIKVGGHFCTRKSVQTGVLTFLILPCRLDTCTLYNSINRSDLCCMKQRFKQSIFLNRRGSSRGPPPKRCTRPTNLAKPLYWACGPQCLLLDIVHIITTVSKFEHSSVHTVTQYAYLATFHQKITCVIGQNLVTLNCLNFSSLEYCIGLLS